MAETVKFITKDDTNITPSVDYNKWLKRMDTQLNEPTYKKIREVPKVVKSTNHY